MRAIVVSELGGPEAMVVTEQPDPVAGPDRFVVEVAAAGVNFIDTYRRSGCLQAAGALRAWQRGRGHGRRRGEGVTEFAVGEHVAWHEGQAATPSGRGTRGPRGPGTRGHRPEESRRPSCYQGLTAHYLCRSTFP